MTDDQLTLFLTTAPPGTLELRRSLVAEHLEMGPQEFREWWRRALETRHLSKSLETAKDEDLIALYQTFDDHEAFAALLRRYETYIEGVVGRIVRHPHAVDEVMQLFRCSMIQALQQFQFQAKARTYMHSVARNEALMYLRGRRRDRVDPDDIALAQVEATPVPIHDHLLHAKIHGLLATLPRHLREPFVARYVHELSAEEASERLHISPGLFRQRVHRARLQMRALLQQHKILG